jgi:hypothetical protein
VLLAATFTAIGFAFDAGSGNRQLSFVFAACYFIGCVLAVLAVRQSGIFTAVIQPPLLLFVSVPSAYFLFTSGQESGLKDLLINCAYPLIERFPLMFFTAAAALLVGVGRWYHGKSTRTSAPRADSGEKSGSGLAASMSSKLSSLLGGPSDDEDDVEEAAPPRRRRSAEASTRTGRAVPARADRASRRLPNRAANRAHHRPRVDQFRPSGAVPSGAVPSDAVPSGAPATNVKSDIAVQTTISPENRTAATEMGHTTRFRRCATEGRRTE